MRSTWFIAGIFLALSGCLQTGIVGPGGTEASNGTSGAQGSANGTSGAQGTANGTSGGQGSGNGTSGAETSGGSNLCPGKVCAPGLICDPADGNCKCYLGGPACGETQICASDGGCVADPCFGVDCAATGAACFGGVCKCGGPNGVECSAPGYGCSPVDNSCGPTASCAITPCSQPGTVCNPTDPIGSQCHCGTIDGAICEKGEDCQLYFADGGEPLTPGEDAGDAAILGECSSHPPCSGVTCPPFEFCDNNNYDPETGKGRCECGGAPQENISGTVCASDEVCIVAFDGGSPECLQICQPFGTPCPDVPVPDASAVITQGCYYFAASQATVCAPPTGDSIAGQGCQLPTDCAISYTCEAYFRDSGAGFTAPACLPYCDVFPPNGPTSTPPPDAGTSACMAGDVCIPLPPGIVAGTCEGE